MKKSDWSKAALMTMIEKEISVQDICEKTGWSRQYVSGTVHGRYNYKNAIIRISKILGIDKPEEI